MKKQEVLDAINKLKPALSDGGILETAGLIILDGERMIAYGDELSVCVPFPLPFFAVLPWKEFDAFIRKVGTEEFDLALDGDKVTLNAKKTTKAWFNVVLLSGDLPTFEEVPEADRIVLPENFNEGLSFCTFSAGSDASLGILQALSVSEGKIVSSDRQRITEFVLSGPCPDILISRGVSDFLSKCGVISIFCGETSDYYWDKDRTMFSQRKIAGEYPETSEFFDVQGEEIDIPLEIDGALERAGIFADGAGVGSKDYVHLSVSRAGICVTGQGTKGGVEERIFTRYGGKPLEIEISAQHLLQILKRTQKAVVGEGAILFVGDDFRHVVALI